jgi:preprotein translocase subunit YajC
MNPLLCSKPAFPVVLPPPGEGAMWTAFVLWAQDAPKPPAQSAPFGLDFLPILVIGGIAYFLLLRPAMRQEKERKALRSSIKKDDKIITSSGIYGVVISVSDKEDEVVVRIADNVRIRMIKAAIDRNLTNEEAAREAKDGKAVASTAVTTKPGT